MKTIVKIGFALALTALITPAFAQEPPAKLTKETQSLPQNGRKTQKKKATTPARNVPAKKMEAKKAAPSR